MTDWPAVLAAAQIELEAAERALAETYAARWFPDWKRDKLRDDVERAKALVRAARFEVEAIARRQDP